MSSGNTYSSNMLFQSITEDLNASLATADELSREFNSLFGEISSTSGSSTQSTNSRSQNTTSSMSGGSGSTSSSSMSGGFGNTSSDSMSGGFGNTSSSSMTGGFGNTSSSSMSGGFGNTSSSSMSNGSGSTSSSSMSSGFGNTSSSSMSGGFGNTSPSSMSGHFGSTSSSSDTYVGLSSGTNYSSLNSGSNASLSSNSSKLNTGAYASSVSRFGSTSSSNISSSPYASISGATKPNISSVSSSTTREASEGTLTRTTMSIPQTSAPIRYSEPINRPTDSFYSGRNLPTSPIPQIQQLAPSQTQFSLPEQAYPGATLTPHSVSPRSQRRASPTFNRSHERTMSGSLPPSHIYDHQPLPNTLHIPTKPVYDSSNTGRKSPRMDRVPSPGPFSQPVASTLPRNFSPSKPSDDTMLSQRNLSKWNETDLDVSYERKPHHTYDKNEWIRPSIPNNSWRESNLDSPSLPKKDPLPRHIPSSDGTLTRTNRISMPPDRASPSQSAYGPQPIISRISIPPISSGTRRHRPIPLSVIMRLQNPYYTAATRYPYITEGEVGVGIPRQPLPIVREFLSHFQPVTPEQKPEPAHYGDGLSPSDVDAEVARINTLNKPSNAGDNPAPIAEQSKEPKAEVTADDQDTDQPPRPLSPSRLQPVVAPEVTLLPDIDELLRARAEFPRALRKRGSVDQSRGIKRPSNQPNQYKQMIKKLFRRKGPQMKIETGNESSSSDGEESLSPPTPTPPTLSTTIMTPQQKGLHSILRKSKASGVKAQSPRARLVPLVLLLDGALVGELDTVKRAVQEMSDPSQPNDEGITALHNAICGGHYDVVGFLVQIGANVSAPDSHGWTPLHCAASCNDRAMCQLLVRNGAAVMAVTESDGATAAQKCDPYAVGYEECWSFLRGVEEMMGVENSGVLYALWSYSAQAPDELSFKEGDMVTILQKPEGVDWWWASLCGREGFVPNNYFGLFPKVRPKSLC